MDIDRLPEIPEQFHNSDTGAPFSHCLVCECDLMEEHLPYAIERAIRHYPQMELKTVIFEYAMCAKCIITMESQLSTETRMAISRYYMENFDTDQRPKWIQAEEDDEPSDFECEDWINRCAVKGSAREELHEYTLCARCIADRIIPDTMPFMLSGEAQDELVELFSNKSLGFLDDFTDRYFTGPPELKELFKGRPILV